MMEVEGCSGPSTGFGGDVKRTKGARTGEDGLAFVDVKVADRRGDVVPVAGPEIVFTISGPGEIVAVDAGDPTCLTPFKSDRIKAFGGLATVIVRRTGKGKITLTANSEGLKKAKLKIK